MEKFTNLFPIYILLSLLFIEIHSLINIVKAPSNIAQLNNAREITLNCSCQANNYYKWNKIRTDGTVISISKAKVIDSQSSEYELEQSGVTEGITTYNLKIKNPLQLNDQGGLYECVFDDSPVEYARAFLIIIKTNPVCTSNVSSELVVGDNVQFECSLTYDGGYDPTIDWTNRGDHGDVQTNSVQGTSTSATFTSILTLTLTEDLNEVAFKTSTFFSSPPQKYLSNEMNDGEKIIEYAKNFPDYKFSHQFDALDIKWPIKNVLIELNDLKDGVIRIKDDISGQLNCVVQGGNPLGNFQWYQIVNGSTEAIAGDSIIISVDTYEENVNYTFTCVGTNGVKDVNISKTLTFSVEIIKPEPVTLKPDPEEETSKNPKPKPKTDSGMAQGTKIGISIAVVILFLIIIAIVIYLCCIRRQAPTKGKPTKEKQRFENVDQIRQPLPGLCMKPDTYLVNERNEPPPPYNANPSGHISWISPRQSEGLAYANLALDDTPRSRKPIQVYEPNEFNGTM